MDDTAEPWVPDPEAIEQPDVDPPTLPHPGPSVRDSVLTARGAAELRARGIPALAGDPIDTHAGAMAEKGVTIR